MYTELTLLADFSDVLRTVTDFFQTVKAAFASFGLLGQLVLALIVFYFLRKAAGGAKKVIESLLSKTSIDNKIAQKLGCEANVEKGFSAFIYGILLLYAAIIALDAGGLDKASGPLHAMLTDILEFIPRAVAAGVLLWILVFIAKIVSQLLGNVLSVAKLDERLGNITGNEPVAKSLVVAAQSFLILLFVPAVLDVLGVAAIADPIKGIVTQITEAVPYILVAGVIIAVGVLIGQIAKRLIENVLNATTVNSFPEKIGLALPSEGKGSVSGIAGLLVQVSVIVLSLTAAINHLNIEILSEFSKGLVGGYFNIVLAVLILGAGLLGSKFAYGALSDKSLMLAKVVRVIIIVMTTVVALKRTNLAPELTGLPYTVAIYAIGVAVAIGGGIALGLGGKDFVNRFLSKRG